MAYNILVTHVPIPNSDIGSWNVMFNNLIRANPNLFTHIICPPVLEKDKNTIYHEVKLPFARHKISWFDEYYSYRPHVAQIKKILGSHKSAVINIIDNINALFAFDQLLKKAGLRHRVRIVFHLHGFAVITSEIEKFYSGIDTLIILTKTSYFHQINEVHSIPSRIKQVYNGVDTNSFYKVEGASKIKLREKLGFDPNKNYFLWLSQDRPKKGLHIILEAWQNFIKNNPNAELIVIGTAKRQGFKQVNFLGRMPNHQLPEYYQMADFYLFSTLCHEGHPLSLTEALLSGNYCIASNIDPIAEILNFGEYGKLVSTPHDPDNWSSALQESLDDFLVNGSRFTIPKEKYALTNWMSNITGILQKEQDILSTYQRGDVNHD